MHLAFYAPLKPPDHPVPSGDRRVARLLIDALCQAGHSVELAARLRSYDGGGHTDHQARLAGIGGQLAARFIKRMHDRKLAERPRAWITYHLYYKAPDWIGPRVAAKLGIPYLAIEASVAQKRAGGPWSLGHEATIAALSRAAAVISLNPADESGIAAHVADSGRLHRLKPFLDAGPYAAAAANRDASRVDIAKRYKLDPQQPWLLAVAMMRSGDKLESYKVLAEALAGLAGRSWSLLVAGDGPASDEVRAAFRSLGDQVRFLGALHDEELPPVYAAADLYVWPAVNEAFGMAMLEAQATGLPVIAGQVGGVGEIVADGRTGLLVPARNAAALASALAPLLDDQQRRAAMSRAARDKVAAEHDLPAASKRLDGILNGVLAVGARP
jgi:glycosyltransferase involved in cell wall biosynthesis